VGCRLPIRGVPLPGARLIADLREHLAQCAGAQRHARLVLQVQIALRLHVRQHAQGIERRDAGGRMAHQHDGGRVVIHQLPLGLLRIGQRGRETIDQALAVLEGVHHDGLDAVAIEQLLGILPPLFHVVQNPAVILKQRLAQRPAVDENRCSGQRRQIK
jgi:hypothetical protein